ncbi:hypothetical protein [Actinomycetospora lemnae]|uniref:Uncharacterized protein n=1 Tax=Actinomycetospora lemnae TaxID=3019891 RepID=A0ABT5SSS5_9PSEU|nr:hypothetical protein [Actinomycetospora sp. DW7H6]MDD7965751.1 hypothetical protein [Actinomycetospora sp. DW7H6]
MTSARAHVRTEPDDEVPPTPRQQVPRVAQREVPELPEDELPSVPDDETVEPSEPALPPVDAPHRQDTEDEPAAPPTARSTPRR